MGTQNDQEERRVDLRKSSRTAAQPKTKTAYGSSTPAAPQGQSSFQALAFAPVVTVYVCGR